MSVSWQTRPVTECRDSCYKTFETLIGIICMPLCAIVHPHPTYFLLFSISCLPQNLMLECLHFSPTAESLYDDE